MATVGENRALRDQYNILLRELRALQEQYNRDRPSIGQDLARDIATFRDIDVKTNSVLFRMEQLQKQNSQNPDLFDPQLAQGIEQNVRAGRDVITASQQVVRQAEQQQARADQGPGTVSTGQTVGEAQQANADGADTQSPAPPAEQANSTGSIEPINPATVPSNADPTQSPIPTTTAAPSKLPPGTTAPAPNTTGAAQIAPGSQSPAPATQQGGANLDSPDENTNRVSYIYRAYQVTSTFRQGRFTQDLQGAQIFFPISPQVAAQKNPDVLRSTPDQSAAETARLQRQAGARPQGTVAQSAGTTGVPIAATAAPGLLDLEGFTDSTGSSTDTSGPAISATEQAPATAPLVTAPVAPGIATRPSAEAQSTQGVSGNSSVEDQLRLARNNKTQFERALADVNARIQRGEGNPLNNRSMRDLFTDNLRRENEIIANLEKQQQSRPAPSAPTTTVAPQQGAREY